MSIGASGQTIISVGCEIVGVGFIVIKKVSSMLTQALVVDFQTIVETIFVPVVLVAAEKGAICPLPKLVKPIFIDGRNV